MLASWRVGGIRIQSFISFWVKAHALIGDNVKAEKYFHLALDYYPSSGHYVYEIASYYAILARRRSAMKYIRSFDPYIEKHRGPHNPRGIFVYKIETLKPKSTITLEIGQRAQRIAQKTSDAKKNVYVITSAQIKAVQHKGILLYKTWRKKLRYMKITLKIIS